MLKYIPKTGDESEIEVENILQPLNSGSGLVCEDLDQVWPGLVSGRLEGVIVELLDAVGDPRSTWVRVRAPLIPEVALVELPPKKACLSRTTTLPPLR